MERILLVVLLGLLAYFVYLVFAPFLVSLAWGAILVILFFPIHRRVRRRIRRGNLAALVTTLLLTMVIILPTLLVLGTIATQAIELAQYVQQEWEQGRLPLSKLWQMLPFERTVQWLAEHGISEEQVRDYVTKGLEHIAAFVAGQTGRLARNLLVFFFDLLVMLLAVFYLFRDGSALMERIRLALPLEEAYREGLFYIAYNVLYASVVSGIVVAAVQGTLGGLLFWAFGIKAPLVWGLAMAFFALLPIVGPWIIWVPAVIFFLLAGSYGKAIGLLILGTLVISGADNVLRPALVSGRAQLNGLLVFISILGGVAAFGFLGIVLGPILVALADAVFQVYAGRQAKEQVARPGVAAK
ncbi:MAG: AI-2E family transporter [Acidobacteria bacterium]|nr:AI-2E family transporter [Acidobacteriota bacterium]